MAIADLNGDGKLDIVGAGRGVSIALGQGDGIFAATSTYATGDLRVAVAVGDLDGDDKPDIVTASDESHTVAVMLGRGDGAFAAETLYASAGASRSLALADIDRDGKRDVVAGLGVLLGRGDGSLGPELLFAANDAPTDVTVGDVDGDGQPDLVAVIGSDPITLEVALGLGDGTFAVSSYAHPAASGEAYVSLGDLNHDGRVDIAVASRYGEVGVMLGEGGGNFALPIEVGTVEYPTGIGLGDVNDDGNLDIVTSGDGAAVLLGHGDGTFGPKVRYPFGPALGLAIADGNGDGRADIAMVVYDDEAWVGWLFGRGDGTFTRGDERAYNPGQHSDWLALADLNGDGHLDLTITNEASVGVWLGKGDGSLSASAEYRGGQKTAAVVLGDVDGDALIDLVTIDAVTFAVSLLPGKGDGTFGSEMALATGANTTTVALADVNGDGIMDAVTANSADVSKQGTLSILLGAGGGTLVHQVDYLIGLGPVAVAVGDLNSDGHPDLAVANVAVDGRGVIGVLLGRGNGTFAHKADLRSGGNPSSIALGDLNGDGWLDIVAASSTPVTSVSVLLGNGAGTFAPNVEYTTGGAPSSVALGDMDGDGRLDVVAASPASSTLIVLLGRGDGTLAPSLEYATAANLVKLADMNGDGRLDAVTDTAVLLGSYRQCPSVARSRSLSLH